MKVYVLTHYHYTDDVEESSSYVMGVYKKKEDAQAAMNDEFKGYEEAEEAEITAPADIDKTDDEIELYDYNSNEVIRYKITECEVK